MNEFMATGRDPALEGRFDRLRALGLLGWGDSYNERGSALRKHLLAARGVTKNHEKAVDRFEMLARNPGNRAEVEAELLRLGLGYRCQNGKVILNGWGRMIDDNWRLANR